MPLALDMVDDIHEVMLVRYGDAWRAKYRGIKPELVKTDWSLQLGGFSGEAIAYGLDNLPPEWPPTVGEFKLLCLRRPEPRQLALPMPKPDPARVAAELKRMRDGIAERDRLQWAADLQERDAAGDRLTLGQRIAWREAQARTAPEMPMKFSPISTDCLPPGMRE